MDTQKNIFPGRYLYGKNIPGLTPGFHNLSESFSMLSLTRESEMFISLFSFIPSSFVRMRCRSASKPAFRSIFIEQLKSQPSIAIILSQRVAAIRKSERWEPIPAVHLKVPRPLFSISIPRRVESCPRFVAPAQGNIKTVPSPDDDFDSGIAFKNSFRF
ncbi:predicted protein [Methanosarcina acetivorans C2A]|uniref:Uncharacterized protein n=1 Tax=Methanosarcina acetivorans (strain ATCC 35395 / DSM 2834 / JCM 12185 / C2A) TaxID=188937 RepID=Q8TTN6_METAC|nr:predicted protein [Methanosarcina acetivorans C2A]